MNDAGYPVTQVQEPSKEDFYAALAEAGLTWEYEDILERHQHPGMRVNDGTVALILHTVRFLESDDSIDVVQVAMVLGPEAAVVARWPGDGLDDAFGEEFADRKDLILAPHRGGPRPRHRGHAGHRGAGRRLRAGGARRRRPRHQRPGRSTTSSTSC